MTTVVPGPGQAAFLPALQGPALPRHGEPGWTVWPRRHWPLDPLAAAPGRLIAATTVAAVAGTALWRPTVLSVGYLVVGVMVFGLVYGFSGRRPRRGEWLGILLTLALLAVPSVLAADWLGMLCIMAAWVMGWCTLVGGRTWTATILGPFVPWAVPSRVSGWVRRGMPRPRAVPNVERVIRVVLVTVVLVVVFGALFATADPAFAHLLDGLVPTVDAGDVVARSAVFGLVAAFVLAGSFLVRYGPRLDSMAPRPGRPVPRWEWALPLGVLDVLFVSFVAVQTSVLFGGHTHVLETEGLTYAEYARQGFWQLLGVSALTLVVLSVALRKAGRSEPRDKLAVRVLIGILCATSIVIVISAIHRMWLYQEAYGFSTLRLLVITVEVWLGVVFVLVAVCGVRMRATWLPRAVLVAGAAALLGLAVLNPERLIADRNIDRYEESGELDAQYLSNLSTDADPALARLPEHVRPCVYHRDDPDPWYEFNLSRWESNRHPVVVSECDYSW